MSFFSTVWGAAALALAVALGVSLAATPLAIRLARWRGWIARPRGDRWHTRPTALMGGIAIYLGVSAGTAGAAGLGLVGDGDAGLLWGGATLMFAVGLLDDLRGLGPAPKLAAQGAAAGLFLAAGYAFGPAWPLWISGPLTVLWVAGITNAVNLLDNMDGLAAGIVGLAALFLTGLALAQGTPGGAAVGAATAGAAVGFLAYNAPPARIFMGDCGSLVLGILAAGLYLVVQPVGGAETNPVRVLAPAAVLAVPLLDTTLVTVARLAAGRPVSKGGRDHASHRLVRLGLSERRAVLVLYGVGVAGGGMGLLAVHLPAAGTTATLAACIATLGAFALRLGLVPVYRPSPPAGSSPTR